MKPGHTNRTVKPKPERMKRYEEIIRRENERHDLHNRIGRRHSSPETNSMAGQACVHKRLILLRSCYHGPKSVH